MTRALCPNCARLAIREVQHAQAAGSNVREATYVCESGHIFMIKWLADDRSNSGALCDNGSTTQESGPRPVLSTPEIQGPHPPHCTRRA